MVCPLGLVAATTGNLAAAAAAAVAAAGSSAGDVDDVVAALVVDTAPALAPGAADTVVLCVTSTGVMFAGSMSGSRIHQVGSAACQPCQSCV